MREIPIKRKDNKGITLIALIVTVIVLIILAGVCISMLTGENGLLGRTGLAKMSTEFASYKEELEQWKMSRTMEDVSFSDDTLSAGKNNLSYGGEKKDGNIKTIIPDLKDDYLDEIEVIKGELVLSTTDSSKINSAKIANVSVNPYEIKDGELVSAGANLDLVSGDGSLTIPENVTKIGSGAFSGVEGLKTVIIPGTVKEIGDNAFSYNTTLEKVIIQDGVETIGIGAFQYCIQLKSVEMKDSVKEIRSSAFSCDYKLEKINLSNKLEKISYNSFSNCDNLSSISIPQSVTQIEDLAFYQCDTLDNIYIPKNINTISSGAFRACSNLNTITIDKDNKNFVLENDIVYKTEEKEKLLVIAIAKCANKKEVTIAEGVTRLSVGALGYFTNVETLYLPSTLLEISGWSFASMGDELKTIIIPESNKYYKVVDNMILSKDGKTFYASSINREEIVIPDGVTTITSASIRGKHIKKVVFGDDVEKINNQIFVQTDNVEQIEMGKGVKSIAPGFRVQSNIIKATLTIDNENTNYVVDGNFVFSKDKKTLISAVNNTVNVSVPNGVEVIENLQDIGLQTITLPDTIKEIKNIQNNGKLKEITIPSSCTTIGEDAFSGCSSLETIKIKNKENSISGAPWGATKGLKVVKWNQ